MPHFRPSRALPGSLERKIEKLKEKRRELLDKVKAIDQRCWEIKRGKHPPKTIEEAVAKIGRRRDREWLMSVLGHIAKGVAVNEAIDDATRACYPALRNKQAIRNQALSQIRKADICQALEDAYEIAGFSLEDAIKTHIGHIKGTHTRPMVVGDELVEVRIPASFQALQAYQKMVLPAQPAKLQVEHTNVTEMLKTIDADGSEVPTLRTIGQVIEVEPEEDPDDRDPFEDDDEEEEEES